jgi:hypothetical protein
MDGIWDGICPFKTYKMFYNDAAGSETGTTNRINTTWVEALLVDLWM